MTHRVESIENASAIVLNVTPRTLKTAQWENFSDDRGVPVWAYKAAMRAVDEWCDGRWADWRLDALAWHAARYLLDEQEKQS
jgi:hypothetical protein